MKSVRLRVTNAAFSTAHTATKSARLEHLLQQSMENAGVSFRGRQSREDTTLFLMGASLRITNSEVVKISSKKF